MTWVEPYSNERGFWVRFPEHFMSIASITAIFLRQYKRGYANNQCGVMEWCYSGAMLRWCQAVYFRQYWLPGNETAIFLISGSSLYIVTWQTSEKCAVSLKIELPVFRGWFLLRFWHSRLRQADFSENINHTRMRPRYTWSAVSACSEPRDRFLKFGRGHFRCDVISGSIGCLATRPRYSCSAALICI